MESLFSAVTNRFVLRCQRRIKGSLSLLFGSIAFVLNCHLKRDEPENHHSNSAKFRTCLLVAFSSFVATTLRITFF